MFSDNCFGQNKNLNSVLANLSLIHQDKFDEIRHVFMTPCHSYLPCDRDFGYIEKEVRHVNVHSKNHYEHFIKKCRQKKPFTVVPVTQDFVLDYALFKHIQQKLSSKAPNSRMTLFLSSPKNINRGSTSTKVTILASNLQ
ncbi:hypothetical protein AVEN_11260-1 [Araneus ventricosus]|uniref:DUF7869 domain-containing protein n=1 Tax=Araneus ventricosus TaxID=182803 RepID=A0A4Y2GN80_ARAVE|nr:hypothetical protein AVEN_11260-1 [Araneus ventricosus]